MPVFLGIIFWILAGIAIYIGIVKLTDEPKY